MEKKVIAHTSEFGSVVLWEGDAYDAIGQWTDLDVTARIKEIYNLSMEKNNLYIDDFIIPNTEYRYNSFEMDNNYNNNINYNNNYIKVIKIGCSIWWLILIMYTIYYICINVNIK
jgi:hypothetical protein